MKKFLSILLAITILLSFTACKKGKPQPTSETTEPPLTQATTETTTVPTETEEPTLVTENTYFDDWKAHYVGFLDNYDWSQYNGIKVAAVDGTSYVKRLIGDGEFYEEAVVCNPYTDEILEQRIEYRSDDDCYIITKDNEGNYTYAKTNNHDIPSINLSFNTEIKYEWTNMITHFYNLDDFVDVLTGVYTVDPEITITTPETYNSVYIYTIDYNGEYESCRVAYQDGEYKYLDGIPLSIAQEDEISLDIDNNIIYIKGSPYNMYFIMDETEDDDITQETTPESGPLTIERNYFVKRDTQEVIAIRDIKESVDLFPLKEAIIKPEIPESAIQVEENDTWNFQKLERSYGKNISYIPK